MWVYRVETGKTQLRVEKVTASTSPALGDVAAALQTTSAELVA